MDDAVELPVAATVELVTVGAPGADGYGWGAVGHLELVARAEPRDVADLAELRGQTYRAHRTALGVDGTELPSKFGELVDAVTAFADPLARATVELHWRATDRR